MTMETDFVGDSPDYGAFIPRQLDDYPLTMAEFRVFSHISRRAGTTEGKFWEGAEKAAKACFMEPKTFSRCILILEQAGLIRVLRNPGKPHEIRLMHYKHWVDPQNLKAIRAAHPSRRRRVNCTDLPRVNCTDLPRVNCTDKGTPMKVLPEGTPMKVNTPLVPQGGNAIAEDDFSDFFEEPDFDQILELQAELTEAEESEIDFASEPPQTTSTQEAKHKPKGSARRRVKSIPENHPETFADWWKTYYEFCLRVDCSPGDRVTAVTTWDVLHAIEPDCTARILEGTDWYCAVKDREFKAKGEVVGVSHGCRFLSKRKWQEALDHKAIKPEFLKNTAALTEAEQTERNIAHLEELRKKLEAKNARNQPV